MSEKNMRVPVKDLVEFMIIALEKMGVPPADVRIIADVLITTDYLTRANQQVRVHCSDAL